MSLFDELKRRNVFKVAIAYLIVAWLVMQVADVVLNNIAAPDWVFQVLMLFLAVGFPFAVIFAWAFELTSKGLRRELGGDLAESKQPVVKKPVPSDRKMIVVLPFENLGPPEHEYFASGMTEEITSRLALVAALGVISRTTAIQYDKAGKSLKQMGDELGVEFVLEGTVRWAKSRTGDSQVRITPQLIRVSDDTHIWADTFERVIDDIFQLQTEIAEDVIKKLGVAMLDPERRNVESTPTSNFDAYQAYLRGLYYARPRGFLEERDRRAVKMLQQAVELDPKFALAHAELCITHSALYHYGFDHSKERLALASHAAQTAANLAPEVPFIHVAYGYYHYWCLRDYDKAYEEFTIAEKGMPGSSEVLAAMGFVRRRQGQFDSALKLFQKSIDLNPMDTHFAIQIADTLCGLGRYSEAIRYYDQSIRFLPNQVAAHVAKASLLWEWKGDVPGARSALENMSEKESNSSFGAIHWIWQEIFEGAYDAALERISRLPDDTVAPQTKDLLRGQIYGFMGERDKSQGAYSSALESFEKDSRKQPENHWLHSVLGMIYAGLGRKSHAIREAKRATELCTVADDVLDGGALLMILALVQAIVGEQEAALDELELLFRGPVGDVEYLPLFPTTRSVAMCRIDPRWSAIVELPRFSEVCVENTIE